MRALLPVIAQVGFVRVVQEETSDEAHRDRSDEMSFPANYDGDCAICPERINKGEEIIMVNGLAQHVDCPMGHVEQNGEACPVCFLVHPAGSCDRQ